MASRLPKVTNPVNPAPFPFTHLRAWWASLAAQLLKNLPATQEILL